jgi:hypothetical protein
MPTNKKHLYRRILEKKSTVIQLLKELPAFCGTARFINVFPT